ncbi:hypothetical protein [Isoptericola rhizosphaerae]|uniref:hypothetical protein n=1 Tax=Isoptericola rhizosphaerae TaxID=3377837 RepID=UPI00383A42AD
MRHRATFTTFVAAGALALTACAAPDESPAATTAATPASELEPSSTVSTAPSGRAETSAPELTQEPTAELLDPDRVVDEAAAVYWASDTTTDKTPLDAARRAGEWLTDEHQALIADDLPGGAGATWIELAEHDGKYIVVTTDATEAMPDLPPDTETTASRGRVIELRPVGTDGWTGERTVLVAQFDLTRPDDTEPWLIDTIATDEPMTAIGDAEHGH